MSAPLDAFVAGNYFGFYTAPFVDTLNSTVYNAAGLTPANAMGIPSWIGATNRGYTMHSQMDAEIVQGDIWGGSVADIVYRGGNMTLEWDSIAFKAGSVVPFWPWGILGSMGSIGRLGSVVGGSIVLVAAPGTPAAGTPAIGQIIINALTAPNAILHEQYAAQMIFDSRLRKLPIKLRLLPYFDRVVGSALNPGQSASLATAGFAVGNAQQTVATIVPTAVAGAAQYTTINTAAYKWYSIL
jgi:hypothetical protein